METYNGRDPWSSNQIRVQLSSCRFIDSDPEPTLVWSVTHFTPIQHKHCKHFDTLVWSVAHFPTQQTHTLHCTHLWDKISNWYFTQCFCSYIHLIWTVFAVRSHFFAVFHIQTKTDLLFLAPWENRTGEFR